MTDLDRRGEQYLDVVRVLLLVQASILLATTIEAAFWSVAFPGAPGATVLLSAAAATTLYVARARLRADRRGTRRLIYVIEGALLVTFALDALLAAFLTASAPPLVAITTRLALPLTVIALLRNASRAGAPAASLVTEGAL